MHDRPRGRAPDYTNAFLVAGLFNLLWMFVLLWVAVGYWAVLAAGWGLNRLITLLEKRRRAAD